MHLRQIHPPHPWGRSGSPSWGGLECFVWVLELPSARPLEVGLPKLDAKFIDGIADARNHDDKRPPDRVRHGHRNLSTCTLTAVVAANWAGAYKFAKDLTEQVADEVKNGRVETPLRRGHSAWSSRTAYHKD